MDIVIFQLDNELEKCAKEMQIPFDQSLLLDINKIQEYVDDIRSRYELLLVERDQFVGGFEDKLSLLEKRIDICDRILNHVNTKRK